MHAQTTPMTEYLATTPGLFPLPDRAKERLSDLKGHQKHDLVDGTEGEPVLEVYASARAAVVETQLEAGLDCVVEGQLRWDDMLAHPLAVHESVETRGLVRYYDNNNFYRDPVVVDALGPSGDVAGELADVDVDAGTLQAVLPGPYSLADLATDEHYGDDAEFLAAVGGFLAGEVEAFPDAGTLFLLEPSLVTSPPGDDERTPAVAAIEEVAGAFPGDVVVHTYWGALDEPTHARLLDARVDAVGYDLVSAPEACLDLVRESGTADGAALGVVDGQNTLVESSGTIRERVGAFEAALPGAASVDTIYATSNTELFYLPVNKHEAKLAALGGALTPEVAA